MFCALSEAKGMDIVMKKKIRIGFLLFLMTCLCYLLPVSATPGVNDYPYANDERTVDPWNFVKRNCTSFVAWRLNNDNGVAFTNQYMGAKRWGDAKDWASKAQSLGITVDSTPAVGAVACWTTGGGGCGHVAWVLTHSETSVTVEEYNGSVRYGYGIRTFTKGASKYPEYFIHIKDLGPKVTITNDISSLYVGEVNGFTYEVNEYITKSDVKWKSDATSVLEVSSNGAIKAKAAGTAKVTAYVVDSSGKMISSDSRTVTVKNPTIKLNYPSATIYGNEKLQLTATVEGPSQKVDWKCSSSMYFSVNSKGLVGLGSMETLQTVSATITATANGVSATCKVTRKPGILEFSKSSCTLYAGSTSTLTAKARGVNSVKYLSSNTAVATVDSKTGKVTAKKEGKAVITAKAGSIAGSYTVNVKPMLQLNKSSLLLNQKGSAKLTATVKGSTKKVKWSSSNSKVVSVSSSGKVTAKKAGKATISVTLKSSSGNITKACSVTVLKPSIKLNITKATLNVGKSITLKATVKGANQNVTWSSSKKSVATVSSSGKVIAKKAGKVTITAKANGKKAKCVITVRKKYSLTEMNNLLNKYLKKKHKGYVSFLTGASEQRGEYVFIIRYQGGKTANVMAGWFDVDPYTRKGVFHNMWGGKQNWKI